MACFFLYFRLKKEEIFRKKELSLRQKWTKTRKKSSSSCIDGKKTTANRCCAIVCAYNIYKCMYMHARAEYRLHNMNNYRTQGRWNNKSTDNNSEGCGRLQFNSDCKSRSTSNGKDEIEIDRCSRSELWLLRRNEKKSYYIRVFFRITWRIKWRKIHIERDGGERSKRSLELAEEKINNTPHHKTCTFRWKKNEILMK